MKTKIKNLLRKMDCELISTRFGIHGDWLVISNDGSEKYFSTLGDILRWVNQ